ncbi:DUF3228 family protein [bacterium]|nr:DUF3228 family protein [bacterium]
MHIALTEFARGKLFRKAANRGLQGTNPDDFLAHINTSSPLAVLDGYAPFCTLHVHANWTDTPVSAVPITDANRHMLHSAYEARSDDELPVLVRWFEGVTPPRADYLLVILYDREQLQREGDAVDADWGVVGCLATAEPAETPMAPITMLRNALGVDEGGSGVAIDRDAYAASVAFWDTHANWR